MSDNKKSEKTPQKSKKKPKTIKEELPETKYGGLPEMDLKKNLGCG